ncbi:hypothetical protein KCP77_01250 [Salmonella enterica subsp. enterica]|nr:hypothetical protein KCP77_01250 [Salmonella enterica subsp. enterica]
MTDALTGKWFRADNIATVARLQLPQRENATGLRGARLCFDIQKALKQTEYRAYRQNFGSTVYRAVHNAFNNDVNA